MRSGGFAEHEPPVSGTGYGTIGLEDEVLPIVGMARHVGGMSSTRDVISLARKREGLITTREALDLAMARSTLDRRINDGVFVRLGKGVLALPGASTRPDSLLRAAGLALGAVVSHQSAARIHGIEPVYKATPSVTVPHRGTYTFPGRRVHQSTDLRPEHVVRVDGVSVTKPARRVLDLAKVLGQSRLEEVVDNALASGIVDFTELMTLYLALTRRGKKGMAKVKSILVERATEERVPASVLETRLFRLLKGAGIPPVKQFHAPWLEPINGRVDFAYVDEEILIEGDSRRWHLLSEAFENDRRRDIAAQLAGWIVIRVTWKMITEEPAFVVETVRQALSMRSSHSRGS